MFDKAKLAARARALLAQARAKGLWPGDDAAFDHALRAARQAIDSGGKRARARLAALDARVAAFRITTAFANRKLARLQQRLRAAKLSPQRRQKLSARAATILRRIFADQLVAASGDISRLLAELEGR